jgi:hypothetical protein
VLIQKDQEVFQRLLTVTLGSTPESAEEIVYLDECVFSQKSYKLMAWASKSENITQSESLGSQPCVAVLAAVSIKRGLILYHQRPKSFNARSFCEFMVDLRESLGHDRPVTIMLDNCRIHKAIISQECSQVCNFDFLWNQSYCPFYNGIEFFWSIAKRRFKSLQLQRMMGTDTGSFTENIGKVMV